MRYRAWLLAAALPIHAYAQTAPVAAPPTDDPDIVVTATRTPTDVRLVPAGVSVVTRDDIDAHDDRSLVDALQVLPGLRLAQSGGAGGQASVFIRGTNSSHVLVLRDGMPINDPSDPSSAFNFGTGTLADIERIEVVRGPMASVYGSGAIGGVINLISRRGTDAGPHLTGTLQGGYPRQVVGDATASGVTGALDYALTVESQSSEGFDSVPRRYSTYAGIPEGYRTQAFTANIGLALNDVTRASLFAQERTVNFGYNPMGFPTYDNAGGAGQVATLLGRAAIDTTFLGLWDSGLSVGRLQNDRQYTQTLDPNDPNGAADDSRYHDYRTDVQWNNTVHVPHGTALDLADVTFGYEHVADQANVRANTLSGGFPFQQQVRAHLDDDAAYGGAELRRGPFSLTGQVRHDETQNESPTTYRIGGVYIAPPIAGAVLRLHAAYGTGFRAASLFDRYGVDNFGYIGNPNLRPEKSGGYELGVDATLPHGLVLGTTYFNTQIRDLIQGVFAPVDTEVNIGSAHIQGFETTLSASPAPWLSLTAQWTYTQAIDASAGTLLLRRPQNTGALDAVIRPTPALEIAPELQFTGAFHDFLSDNNGFPTQVGTSRQGTLVNLAASYRIARGVKLVASGRNLFESRFEPVAGYETPGTSFLAGIRLEL